MEKKINDVKTSFSKSELRVVELLAKGYTEKEIADKLYVSPHTINNHLRNIRERNGLHKNTEIILLYIAYLNRRHFSMEAIREVGIGAILILLNVCEYTKPQL